MWRVKDADNYYVARFNPLESNVRFYKVTGGVRRQIAGARVPYKAGTWVTMKIVQNGTHVETWLNGRKWIEADNDAITGEGGVGLWTKADAVTEFDDFTVRK